MWYVPVVSFLLAQDGRKPVEDEIEHNLLDPRLDSATKVKDQTSLISSTKTYSIRSLHLGMN